MLDIKHIESNLRHHSRPGAYPWYILTTAAGNEPLMVSPPGYNVEPALWYKASLFTEKRVAEVAEIAADQLGEPVQAILLVDYLDGLRDRLVRQERAEAGALIHG